MFYYIHSETGYDWLRPVAVLVRGSWILKVSGTGLVFSPSKKGNRTETRPDFKALNLECIDIWEHLKYLPIYLRWTLYTGNIFCAVGQPYSDASTRSMIVRSRRKFKCCNSLLASSDCWHLIFDILNGRKSINHLKISLLIT